MKKFILLFCFFFSSLSNAQESIKLWLVDADYCFYLGQSTVSHINLPTAKLAIIRGNTDTLWFNYGTKETVRMPFAFNPADLLAKSTLKLRFAIGDSVTALLVRQPNQYWINGIVLAISPSNRYLLKFREIADYNERTKKFNYRNVRSWFDENDVEKFVDAKKFR